MGEIVMLDKPVGPLPERVCKGHFIAVATDYQKFVAQAAQCCEKGDYVLLSPANGKFYRYKKTTNNS